MKYLFIALLFTVNLSHAASLSGRVVGVADGDTITVLDQNNTQYTIHNTQYTIRLSGIDAPEKKQDFGNVSKKSLFDLVYDQAVIVDWSKQDRYGRIVGKVTYKGQDINLLQVKLGMAWFYRNYQNELSQDDRILYLHAEEDALNNGTGLWLHPNPIAPGTLGKIAGQTKGQSYT